MTEAVEDRDAPFSAGGALADTGQPRRHPFAIHAVGTAADGPLPVSERELAATPFLTLRRFDTVPATTRAPVLLVPPLSGHYPVLMRDVVLGLLPRRPVAVLDWASPRHVPLAEGTFGFEDNVASVVDALRRLGPGSGVLGLCQGGTPALAAVAAMAERAPEAAPAALALVAAPIDVLANPTGVVRLARAHAPSWFRHVPVERVPADSPARGRRVYPARLQRRALRAYLARHMAEGTDLATKVLHDDGAAPESFPFLALYSAVMDIDARHYAENIEAVFHDRALATGTMRLGGAPVRPGAIRETALMTIEGEADDVAAPGQTARAHDLCPDLPGSRRARLVLPGGGHFALFHGARWRGEVLPRLEAFLDRAGV